MWGAIIGGITSVVDGFFKTKRAKQEAEASYNLMLAKGEQDWDVMAMKNSQFSWKDEFITIIIFAPLIVAWFDQDKALAWVDFVTQLPYWYQVMMFGIIAASFGLRWLFRREGFKVSHMKHPENPSDKL